MAKSPRNRTKSAWRYLLNALRFLISGGLIVFLVWQANPLTILEAWRQADVRLLILAFLLQLVGIALSSAKWGVLLRARGHQQPYSWLISAYLAGQFANNFLPTTVGGDGLRALQLSRRIGSLSQASASIFIERLTGFLALSLIANSALLISYAQVTGSSLVTKPWLFFTTIGFSLLAVAVAVASFLAPWIERLLGPYLPAIARYPMKRITSALGDYFPQGWTLVLVVLISLLFQSLWVGIHVLCGMALGIDEASLLLYALMVPMTDIVGMFPIFFNNLGARDVVFTLYLTQVGVPPATALALSLMVFSLRLLSSLLGGLVVFFGGADLRTTKVSSPDALSSES